MSLFKWSYSQFLFSWNIVSNLLNKRDQQEGETFNDYIAALRILAQTCNFCACLRDTLLRDRIVLGIRSARTRKRLLEERNLTLKKCIDTCKSDETAHQHLHAFQTFQLLLSKVSKCSGDFIPGAALGRLATAPPCSPASFPPSGPCMMSGADDYVHTNVISEKPSQHFEHVLTILCISARAC